MHHNDKFHNNFAVSPELVQAYRETDYRVWGENGLVMVLKIGVQNPKLVEAHQKQHTDCSAFISAYNPFSQGLTPEENTVRHKKLAAELSSQGLVFWEGIGQHPTNTWDGEASFLVFGLTLKAAKAWCTQLEQHAFVWNSEDGVPQLILTNAQSNITQKSHSG